MIIVDTSFWIAHFRERAPRLLWVLASGLVLCHAFVIGELACGNLKDRQTTLDLLLELPSAPLASHTEALTFLDRHQLHGRGVGWIDTHLLASAALAGATIWTFDRRMAAMAAGIGLLG